MAAHEYLHHLHAFTQQTKPIEYELTNMNHPTDLKWQLFITNCIIGFAIIGLLQSLIRLWPSRTTGRLRLCATFAAIYALAVAINIVLPDLFNAIEAFISAQPVCARNAMSCYAAGGASWMDNFTLRNPVTLVACNKALHACYNASVFGFFARILG